MVDSAEGVEILIIMGKITEPIALVAVSSNVCIKRRNDSEPY